MNKATEKAAEMCAAATAGTLKATDKAVNAVGKALQTRWGKYLLVLPLALSCLTMTVFAADAEAFITQITDLLKTWIPRLGGMIVVVGGIQLGIGFKDEDTTGKTRGMQTMIGGAIVAAIGTLVEI